MKLIGLLSSIAGSAIVTLSIFGIIAGMSMSHSHYEPNLGVVFVGLPIGIGLVGLIVCIAGILVVITCRDNRKVLWWTAGIISVLPGFIATIFVAVNTAIWAARFGSSWDPVREAAILFVILVLPGIIAWRWHLGGGLLLIVEAGLNMFMIAVSLITHDAYAYFELDQTLVAYVILPMWMAMFVGGLQHVVISRPGKAEQLH